MPANTMDRVPKVRQDSSPACVAVCDWVLSELGAPRNLLMAEAKPLWDNYFRVNIFTAKDTGRSAREISVSDSFFVFKSEDGYLSNPPITRKYEPV